MQELINNMEHGYLQVTGGGQYLALFFLASIMLVLYKGKKEKELYIYGIVVIFLLLCPLTAFGLLKYQTAFYSYASLWNLLPLILVIAYAAVIILHMARQYSVGKPVIGHKKYGEPLLVFLISLLIFMAGTISFAKENTVKAANSFKIPAEELEVLQEVSSLNGAVLLGPDKLLEYARAYSGELELIYGRNMWNPALNAYTYDTYSADLIRLHDWMNGEGDMSPDEALKIAFAHDCNVLVLEKEAFNNELQKTLNKIETFSYAGEIGNYVILIHS